MPVSRFLPAAFRQRLLNHAGNAGPRRLAVIGAVAAAMIGTSGAALMLRDEAPPAAHPVALPPVNPLPGGLESNPLQDALAVRTAQEEADKAAAAGQSYTPPLAASRPVEQEVVNDPPPADPVAAPQVADVAPPTPVAAEPRPNTGFQHVSATSQDGQAQGTPTQGKWNAADLFRGWGRAVPRTDVAIPAAEETAEQRPAAASVSPSAKTADPLVPSGRVLVPAGRGLYAHTVLAVNSDSGGPIVLQADSGPLAGDRMIGTFNKSGTDRLVVRIQTIEHRGKPIDVSGIVIAPDTMETAVASSIDEHYLERFVLPAAASFVEGLGQAIATSNTTSTVSPLTGSVTGITKLHLGQQMGIGAGMAAQQVGTALSQEAPKGPTINLAASVNVGVMFLSNVTENGTKEEAR